VKWVLEHGLENIPLKLRYSYLSSKWVKRLIGTCIVIAIFFFLGRRLYIDWQELKDYDWHVQPFWLVLSFAFLILWWVALSLGWSFLLHRLKVNLPFKMGFKFWAISQLGRYLPGKFWHILGRAYFCAEKDIEKSVTVASALLEVALMAIAAGLIFLLALPLMTSAHSLDMVFYILVIPLGLLSIHPLLFSKVFSFAAKKLRVTGFQLDLSYVKMLSFVGIHMTLWLVCGLAFFLFVNSVHRVSWNEFFPVTGTYAIAWIMGLLSVFTPGGLGVREGALGVLLTNYMPAPIAVVVALLSRIWFVGAEVVCAAVAWKL
jgi:uncharacterized membrane protein YbhN (UPF0104 family)